MTLLGPGVEFDRLRGVFRRLASADVLGDDCALIQVADTPLAISSDLSIENRHFRRAWLSAEEIGWRAASAALSDLAACAVAPQGLLTSLGLPADLPATFLEDLMAGVDAAGRAVGASVWGGDLAASDAITIDITVIGHAPHPVRRQGAVPGDGVWVTGAFGGPAAAVRAWETGGEPAVAARARFAHPEPRIAWAAWLRDHGASAMLDVSDGLAGDAGHLASASGVRLALAVDAVPLHPAAAGWEDAVQGGEEYELLVTLPASLTDTPAWLTRIGAVEAGQGVVWTRGGQEVAVGAGFSHF